jgi:aspartate carbamoyltransferase catalytic subunit
MHSISYAMSQFDINAFYVSPPEMSLTDEFKKELNDLNLNFKEIEHVEQAISEADVVYMEPVVQPDYTKARDERGATVGMTPDNYKVTRELMRKAPQDSIALPRMHELSVEVDDTRHQRYWIEAFNGVVVRMALLALVLGAME